MNSILENFTSELLWRLGLGLLSVIVTLVVPILANQARLYFLVLREEGAAQLGTERFNLVWGFTEAMIRSAEQQLGLETNAQKKEFVVNAVYTFAHTQGWPLTREQVDDFVEGVFNAVKPSLKDPNPYLLAPPTTFTPAG